MSRPICWQLNSVHWQNFDLYKINLSRGYPIFAPWKIKEKKMKKPLIYLWHPISLTKSFSTIKWGCLQKPGSHYLKNGGPRAIFQSVDVKMQLRCQFSKFYFLVMGLNHLETNFAFDTTIITNPEWTEEVVFTQRK